VRRLRQRLQVRAKRLRRGQIEELGLALSLRIYPVGYEAGERVLRLKWLDE
jgi:hypothetical protein